MTTLMGDNFGVNNRARGRTASRRRGYATILLILFGMLAINLRLHSEGIAAAVFGAPDVPVIVGIVADCQYADAPQRSKRHYRASLGKLSDAVSLFNARDLTFAVHLGDFVDRDAANYSNVMRVWRTIDAPRFGVIGNHDCTPSTGESIDFVIDAMELPGRYYAFTRGDWRFIFIDGNDASVAQLQPGDVGYEQAAQVVQVMKYLQEPNRWRWSGLISDAQLGWLRNELHDAKSNRLRICVFCHHPVRPRDGGQMFNCERVVSLMREFEADAYFNGHEHDGNYVVEHGIHYVTFKGMVNEPGNAYAVASFCKDKITIEGFGREPSRTLELR